MPEVTVLYWRDIPAQVIVGRGRRGIKRVLADRFEQAIDRAAMKAGVAASDAYLAEWRKAEPVSRDGDPEALAEEAAQRLETAYGADRLKALIDNDGWA
ncbi:MAG: virulence factor [Pseudodonghicola sp.]